MQLLLIYLFIFARQNKQIVQITAWEVRMRQFNLKLFQNLCKNAIATEERGENADMAYGSSLEVSQNQTASAN